MRRLQFAGAVSCKFSLACTTLLTIDLRLSRDGEPIAIGYRLRDNRSSIVSKVVHARENLQETAPSN